MPFVDLNADLGESFGAYTIGADAEVMQLVSSCHAACGFHASDPRVMRETVRLAKRYGVALGAHPGFPDRVGFGRRPMQITGEEAETDTIYQVGALLAFCRAEGVPLRHVKPHGALYNVSQVTQEVAEGIVRGIQQVDPNLLVYAQPGLQLEAACAKYGVRFAHEVFADRHYNADGTLVSRRVPGALIQDPELAAAHVLRMVRDGQVRAMDGKLVAIQADTVCFHGDNPAVLANLRAVRRALEAAGIEIRTVG